MIYSEKQGYNCYFGEDVDDYEDGQIVGHGGAWLAGENGARAGLFMPGNVQVGMKYYQEFAPGIAEDRADHKRERGTKCACWKLH